MQSTVSIEQEITEGVKALPAHQQQEVLDFVEFLRQKSSSTQPENRISMQELAQLPIAERHQRLKQYIPAMVEDFKNDPALTEFSDLDMDDWAVDDA